jgi:hypothetical protein
VGSWVCAELVRYPRCRRPSLASLGTLLVHTLGGRVQDHAWLNPRRMALHGQDRGGACGTLGGSGASPRSSPFACLGSLSWGLIRSQGPTAEPPPLSHFRTLREGTAASWPPLLRPLVQAATPRGRQRAARSLAPSSRRSAAYPVPKFSASPAAASSGGLPWERLILSFPLECGVTRLCPPVVSAASPR